MKKITALLLVAVMCISLAACSAGTKNKLTPKKDLPEYSEDFQKVLDNVDVAEEDIASFMGYALAAYETYEAKEFCDYVYSELDFTAFDAISDAVAAEIDELSTKETAEAMRLSLSLQTIKFNFVTASTLKAAVNSDYAKATEESDYESFKESYANALNQYADILYGTDLFIAG